MAVVVDASLAVKWVVPQKHTEHALALLDRWQVASERLIAPPIYRSEVTNVVHQYMRRGHLDRSEAADVLDALIDIVAIGEPEGLYSRALTLANQTQQGSTYDSLYLALAEHEECEMWTADRRFVRGVQRQFTRVRWLGELPRRDT